MARSSCGRGGNDDEPAATVRKGPWTLEEDLILVSYISQNGEGSWDNLARSAGLNRNGKSCRLRWLNYLRPGVRRGSITAGEDTVIREIHARWGNKWSKISKHLPGRTDNEIKNYWRTRIQQKKPGAAKTAAQQEPSSTTVSSGSGGASRDYYWCTKPDPDPDQQAAYYCQKAAMAAAAATATTTAAAFGVSSEGASSSALTTSQEDSSTATAAGEWYMHQQTTSYPYCSELSLVAGHGETVGQLDALTMQFLSSHFAASFGTDGGGVDDFWETKPITDAF